MENINKIDFEENKPYNAPHYPFSLEGHWQPWYDDRRDYNTNALDELAATRPMLVLNVVVNFLAEDVTRVWENMSQVDKAVLKELVNKL